MSIPTELATARFQPAKHSSCVATSSLSLCLQHAQTNTSWASINHRLWEGNGECVTLPRLLSLRRVKESEHFHYVISSSPPPPNPIPNSLLLQHHMYTLLTLSNRYLVVLHSFTDTFNLTRAATNDYFIIAKSSSGSLLTPETNNIQFTITEDNAFLY